MTNDHDTTISLADLKAQLEQERAELTAHLEEALGIQPEDRPATDGHGETEHLKVLEERSVLATIGSITRSSLDEVLAALERIDDGTYGDCLDCGNQIPFARLEVMPAARYCVSCQQRHEI